ncbi:hypothetical protein FRX31_035543 [Thalictrum thalictroides]|uniref:Uncharacterized protein n=1 Tax=Thalictrum thalictroides TaxID=46969 RepID=A0A7J6UQZ8_THATH|nr:hypothetical protein FRX31_035543 [Thalictrum thalictroides]
MATASAPAQAHVSASLYHSIRDVKAVNSRPAHAITRLPLSNTGRIATSFARGSPLCKFFLAQFLTSSALVPAIS